MIKPTAAILIYQPLDLPTSSVVTGLLGYKHQYSTVLRDQYGRSVRLWLIKSMLRIALLTILEPKNGLNSSSLLRTMHPPPSLPYLASSETASMSYVWWRIKMFTHTITSLVGVTAPRANAWPHPSVSYRSIAKSTQRLLHFSMAA